VISSKKSATFWDHALKQRRLEAEKQMSSFQ
jgi:hypothetical protein